MSVGVRVAFDAVFAVVDTAEGEQGVVATAAVARGTLVKNDGFVWIVSDATQAQESRQVCLEQRQASYVRQWLAVQRKFRESQPELSACMAQLRPHRTHGQYQGEWLDEVLRKNGWTHTVDKGGMKHTMLAIYKGSKYNHSCQPNVHPHLIAPQDSVSPEVADTNAQHDPKELWVQALCDIAIGDQVTVSYVKTLHKDVLRRRNKLAVAWGFLCACERCQQELQPRALSPPLPTRYRGSPTPPLPSTAVAAEDTTWLDMLAQHACHAPRLPSLPPQVVPEWTRVVVQRAQACSAQQLSDAVQALPATVVQRLGSKNACEREERLAGEKRRAMVIQKQRADEMDRYNRTGQIGIKYGVAWIAQKYPNRFPLWRDLSTPADQSRWACFDMIDACDTRRMRAELRTDAGPLLVLVMMFRLLQLTDAYFRCSDTDSLQTMAQKHFTGFFHDKFERLESVFPHLAKDKRPDTSPARLLLQPHLSLLAQAKELLCSDTFTTHAVCDLASRVTHIMPELRLTEGDQPKHSALWWQAALRAQVARYEHSNGTSPRIANHHYVLCVLLAAVQHPGPTDAADATGQGTD